jgi:hypothetical protein
MQQRRRLVLHRHWRCCKRRRRHLPLQPHRARARRAQFKGWFSSRRALALRWERWMNFLGASLAAGLAPVSGLGDEVAFAALGIFGVLRHVQSFQNAPKNFGGARPLYRCQPGQPVGRRASGCRTRPSAGRTRAVQAARLPRPPRCWRQSARCTPGRNSMPVRRTSSA